MTVAQIVILDEEQTRAYRRAEQQARRDGAPQSLGSFGDLAGMVGGLG